jgi:alkylglycerol monooxygenase
MNANPIMLAIPFFFLAMGIEILIDRYKQTGLYRLNDSITNLNAGTSQQVVGIFLKVFTLGLYEAIYANFALFKVPHVWWSWLVAFILYDLCYYWSHRMSHEVNLFWSGHVVHHQSEEYNLSVALRQSWFQGIWTAPFYLPMALLGFDTTQLLIVGGINLIYQFWIHTELIDRMGPLEWVMNTPSHHRVHHGRNPKYIDKNHAGTFIVWDRLFGTFQAEEERPVYGITTPINSWNPVWANFSHYEAIGQQLRQAHTLSDKLRLGCQDGRLPAHPRCEPGRLPEIRHQRTPQHKRLRAVPVRHNDHRHAALPATSGRTDLARQDRDCPADWRHGSQLWLAVRAAYPGLPGRGGAGVTGGGGGHVPAAARE